MKAETTVADYGAATQLGPPAGPEEHVPLRELASRYGLRAAGERPPLVTYARQLWAYRGFIGSFGQAKVVAAFTTTRLGQLWQVLTPLSNFAVYYLIFGLVLGTSRGIPNFTAYLCIGIFVFGFTSSLAGTAVQSISGNLGIIRALQFPRASLPLAALVTQLQQMLVATGVLIVVVLATGEPVRFEWFLIVPALALQTLFNAGLGMILARMGAKIIDLRQLVPFITRTWMYASGVLYNVSYFDAHLGAFGPIMTLNPMLIYVELMRNALLPTAPLTASPIRLWTIGIVWAVIAALVGFVYFWRHEQEYGRG